MTELPDSLNPWLKKRLTLPLLILNGWVCLQLFQFFDPFVTIFVLSTVLAFVLNYPVRFLEQRGVGRNYAVLLVLLVSFVGVTAIGVTLVPILLTQLNEIATLLPTWVDVTQQDLENLEAWATSHRLPINLSQTVAQISDRIPSELQALSEQSLSLALDAIDSLTDILLTVVLTFYLLMDGQRLWNAVFQRLPFKNRDFLRAAIQEDFHSYFIGQVTLSLLMGTALSLAFFVLKVPYSLLLGLIIGLLTLIPFGDTVGFIAVSLFISVQDLSLGIRTFGVALVIDQILDQAIAPRILGGFTGLKPIWVILALLFGTKVAGLAGLLLAVPLASFLQTLLDQSFLPPVDEAIACQPESASDSNRNQQSVEPSKF